MNDLNLSLSYLSESLKLIPKLIIKLIPKKMKVKDTSPEPALEDAFISMLSGVGGAAAAAPSMLSSVRERTPFSFGTPSFFGVCFAGAAGLRFFFFDGSCAGLAFRVQGLGLGV